MLGTLAEDHIRTARAYGLPERQVIGRQRAARRPEPADHVGGAGRRRHPHLVGATRVGVRPARHRPLTVQAVRNVDLPVVVGLVLLIGFVIVVCNTIADLLYAAVDKRVSVS